MSFDKVKLLIDKIDKNKRLLEVLNSRSTNLDVINYDRHWETTLSSEAFDKVKPILVSDIEQNNEELTLQLKELTEQL